MGHMPIHGLSQNGYLNDQWAKPPMQAIFKGIFMDITEPFKDHIKEIYIYIYIYTYIHIYSLACKRIGEINKFHLLII